MKRFVSASGCGVQLSKVADDFIWNVHESGKFSLDFMYTALVHSDAPVDNNKKIWKMKVPLRIKVFGMYIS
jgi:hypothetical protein